MVEALRPSAEKYGWVVIGCDTIQNGSNPLDSYRFYEILMDVRNRIPHDRRETYLAGFSGGGMRAYGFTRTFWNEFAGVIAFGGWIGNYDDDDWFPSRLAIARLNGSNDTGAIYWGNIDSGYFLSSGCSLRYYLSDGGHQIASPPYVDQAMSWLMQDFQTNGVLHLPTNQVAEAPHALSLARAAFRQGQYGLSATQTVHFISYYPWCWESQEGEGLLVGIFSNALFSSSFEMDAADPRAYYNSWIFMSRALIDSGGFPPAREPALLELAVALCPSNAYASAQLAHVLLESTPLTTQVVARATTLSDTSVTLSPGSWWSWYVRSEAAAASGQYQDATNDVTIAMQVNFNPNNGWQIQMCQDALNSYLTHLP